MVLNWTKYLNKWPYWKQLLPLLRVMTVNCHVTVYKILEKKIKIF